MTPQQLAELEKLDAAIAAAPTKWELLRHRAWFLAEHGADFDLVFADIKKANRMAERAQNSAVSRYGRFGQARNFWRRSQLSFPQGNPRYHQALAVYCFLRALEKPSRSMEPRVRILWPAQALDILRCVATIDENGLALELEGAGVESLNVWALVLAITRDDVLAAQIYARALRLQHGALEAAQCVRLARAYHDANYRRLAWWNLAVEAAPDDPNWRIERGRCLANEDYEAEALEDLARAIALAPDDPKIHETRARLNITGNWWDMETGKAGDHARAIRLRIAAGQIVDTPEYLKSQGDRLRAFFRTAKQRERAYAFYSLALETRPRWPELYLARAHALDPRSSGLKLHRVWLFMPKEPDEEQAAYFDYARALALDGSLDEARAKIIEHLTRTLKRATAHEQIEALLEARRELVEFGIAPGLVGEIIGEVGRALTA